MVDYRPPMLDELIASGEVVWVGGRREDEAGEMGDSARQRGKSSSRQSASVGLIAFYPTDSPFAPARPDIEDGLFETAIPEPGLDRSSDDADEAVGEATVEEAVIDVLGYGGGLFFGQIVDALRRRLAPAAIDEGAVAAVLQKLMWQGRATNDTFAPVRVAASGDATPRPRTAARRRVSSRRARMRADYGEATATGPRVSSLAGIRGVQSGRWSLVSPSTENDTVRALALVDSLLDRYGVLTRDIALVAGVPGGLGSLMPVLRSMEDAGDLLRGMFVEGLGPAQFAARETIDALRTYAAGADAEQRAEAVVLAADDPASLFGAGIPWPPIAEEDGGGDDPGGDSADRTVRPSRRAGGLVVVRSGAPVLFATAGLRSVLAFSDESAAIADAAHALADHVQCALRHEGEAGARKKVLVEEFNGQPVLDTPFSAVLQREGFVRLPDGMRLYVSPF